jgi:hypothetical protein
MAAKTIGATVFMTLVIAAGAACEDDAQTTGPGGSGGSPTGTGPGGSGGEAGQGAGGGVAGGGGDGAAAGAAGMGGSGGAPITSNANCDPPAGASGNLTRTEVASGLTFPVMLTHARGDSTRLYVVEKAGRIVLLKGGVATEFLDIRDRVQSGTMPSDERGLLGLTFHPDYLVNGRFFVHFSNEGVPGVGDSDTVIEEYRRDPVDPDVADDTPVQLILTQDQPAGNHNGGSIEFSPSDGFLYIGLGDGGGSFDTYNNGQNLGTKLAKLLRIDIDSAMPYAIPSGNVVGGEPAIYDQGLRNPYRWSFDICTGDRYIGDVGQNCYEEVDIAGAAAGPRNWGWSVMEGAHCLDQDGFQNGLECDLVPPGDCSSAGFDAPAVELTRTQSTTVVGGHVYRGSAIPWLRGAYFYADFGGGAVWYLRWSGGLVTEGPVSVANQLGGITIAAFGIDNDGELYLVDYGGAVFKIEAE